MALAFERFSKEATSINERPLFYLWGAQLGFILPDIVFVTCLEQFQQAPSKAKSQAIYEWLLDPDTKKAAQFNWGSMNLQSDGTSGFRKKIDYINESSRYYISRKTWVGKLRNERQSQLGNHPSSTMYDLILNFALMNIETDSSSIPFRTFTPDMVDRSQGYVIQGLKSLELLERDFRKAGFNTAKMGFRLPFKFK